MKFLYNTGISFYVFLIRIASLFHKKARLWIEGRKAPIPEINKSQGRVAWIHCASLGEFEQGRPLIETFRKKYPDWQIILTFFSPSGYEVRKNYSGADKVLYLPSDTPKNAARFIELIKPDLAIFVKYEFWFNYVSILKKKKIPLFLVSAIFREEQYFFSWWSVWFRKRLRDYNQIFVQDAGSSRLLSKYNIPNIIAGDTRFDRVNEVVSNPMEIMLIPYFQNNGKLIVAGSTWQEDEDILLSFMENQKIINENIRLILAPHEINEEHLKAIEDKSGDYLLRFSQATPENIGAARILLIDNIGMLSSLYRYADIAYIGGGFGKGIHNILEAAAYGIPVLFGNNYEKFNEAVSLKEKKGAFVITGIRSFTEIALKLLFTDKLRLEAGKFCSDFVKENTGATFRILQHIEKEI